MNLIAWIANSMDVTGVVEEETKGKSTYSNDSTNSEANEIDETITNSLDVDSTRALSECSKGTINSQSISPFSPLYRLNLLHSPEQPV